MNIKNKVASFNKGETITDTNDRITVSDNDDGLHCVKWSMRFMHVDAVIRYTRNGKTVLCSNGKLRVTRNRARPILAPYGITIDNKGVFYRGRVPIDIGWLFCVLDADGKIDRIIYSGFGAEEKIRNCLYRDN